MILNASYASKDRGMSKMRRFGERSRAAISTDKNTVKGEGRRMCLYMSHGWSHCGLQVEY